MLSRWAASGAALVIAASMGAACEREHRQFEPPVVAATRGGVVRLTPVGAGGPTPFGRPRSPYQENAYGISEGKRLYQSFNCNGCHASGGGGIGPALMDDKWIYGESPEQIFSSIVQGRPDGMPSFADKITDDQVWQIVAYVQSLGANVPRDASTSRADDMATTRPEVRLERMSPRQTGHR